MIGTLLVKDRLGVTGIAAAAALASIAAPAFAQAPAAPPAAEAPAAPAAPTSPLTQPSMAGPLTANATPMKFEAGPLDTIYVTGAVSGLGLFQTDHIAGDHASNVDISNGQVIVQKVDGVFQFYAQAGAYSLPALGTNYFITQRASNALSNYFGPLPVAYGKVVVNDVFSVSAGKLPTLIGNEYTFTFQNMNIERGLLWNQEPAISKGVQANLTTGPLAWAVSFNDGFYSDRYNWLSGNVTWTIDPQNTLIFCGGGNLGTSNITTIAAPFPQNNGDVFNLMYTYTNAPWTISPYVQYTNARHSVTLAASTKDATTWGGAILASYQFTPNWSLAGRAEYIAQSGSATDGTVNVLYGPGSDAFSFTLTPTYQEGIFFGRAEGSVVSASSITPGLAFGKTGTSKTQGRLLLEAGILF
jgi:hypothetical protein